MAKSNFENLRVYNLSEHLADLVWDIVSHWNTFAMDTVGKQLVRAADSIGANIAEGDGRGSYADNKRFVKISRGSLNETRHFLRRAYKRKLMNDNQVKELKVFVDELSPKLNAYLKSIGKAKSANNN
ncbi:MAG: four helix bundle protein [Bacteroidia bacterium]